MNELNSRMMDFLSTSRVLFGDTYATGEYAAGNVEDLLMSEGEDGGGSGVGDSEEFSEYHINEGVFTPDITVTPIREKHKLNRTPNSKRGRKSNTYDASGTCKAIQEMIKFKSGQSTSGSVISHAPPPVGLYSIGVVVAILNGMPNLEQDLYNKVVNQILEGLLKLPENRECADCKTKYQYNCIRRDNRNCVQLDYT